MRLENFRIKAIAVIKLFKDFAEPYPQRAASRTRSREIHPQPQVGTPQATGCMAAELRSQSRTRGLPPNGESSRCPPSTRPSGFSLRAPQPYNPSAGDSCPFVRDRSCTEIYVFSGADFGGRGMCPAQFFILHIWRSFIINRKQRSACVD